MNATETRLLFEIEDARRNIAVFEREQQHFQQEADKWKAHKQAAHAVLYRAKKELELLTTPTHADH